MTAVNFMKGRISGKLARYPIEWVGEIKITLCVVELICSHVAIVVTTETRPDPASSLTQFLEVLGDGVTILLRRRFWRAGTCTFCVLLARPFI